MPVRGLGSGMNEIVVEEVEVLSFTMALKMALNPD
jgi:hypothetical protein